MLDPDIRSALIPSIRPSAGEGRLLQEVGLWNNTVRIDLARLTPYRLDGYEIKSQGDSLARLSRQADIYNLVCDTVTLVAAPKHIEKAASSIPDWWGLIEAIPEGGSVTLTDRRVGGLNPSPSAERIAGLLWKDEAISLLRKRGKRSLSRLRADEAYALLAVSVPLGELRREVFARLATRVEWLEQHDPEPVAPIASLKARVP